MIYLDNAATTQVFGNGSEAGIVHSSYLNFFGNPSSAYDIQGINLRNEINDVRTNICMSIGAKDGKGIYFTSGGTEADNWAIKGVVVDVMLKGKGNHIITTQIEHPAVLRTCEYLEKEYGVIVTYLPVNECGLIDLKELEDSITDNTIMISIMAANNEIGTIQPLYEIGKIAKKHSILFHTDAVQAYMHIPIDVDEMGIDMLSASGHKIGASKGIGFLYVRDGIKIQPLIHGGGQEIGMRSGTENVPGIMGLGATVNYHMSNFNEIYEKYYTLRRSAEMMLLTEFGDRVKINGADDKDALPNILSVTFKDKSSSDILAFLESMEIYASAGSACSSGKDKNSHVLEAIGLNDNECKSTIRFSFGLMNNIEEIEKLIKVLRYAIK